MNGDSNYGPYWSAVFKDNSEVTGIQWSIAHELGHQLDVYFGRPSQNNAAFTAAYNADMSKLNGEPCTAVFTATVCQPYPGKTAWYVFTANYKTTNIELWATAIQYHLVTAGVGPELLAAESALTNINSYMTNTFFKTNKP